MPGKKYKTKEFCDEDNLVYRKLYFLNGIFCGGILIGDTKSQKELFASFEGKLPIDKM
jgi:NAD(P)H-nitrite reductase large subunit